MRWILTLLFCFLPLAASAAEPASPETCAPDGVALGGYDLVSYRQPGGPLPGSPDTSVEHDGLTYRFASERHRELFVADPDAYLPRYQGWCAATLAMGRLNCPDYTNFKIEQGELLLFELAGFTNGRTLWNTDPTGFRTRADSNALKLLK